MSLNAIFDIAGTGMNAQSIRLNTTASNLANADAASSSIDETYRGRHPVFAALDNDMLNLNAKVDGANIGVGVLGIVESDAPLQPRYEPNHPLADDQGYVYYPNVNVVEEMANMISASRAYQTNVQVADASKQMLLRTLQMGQ